LATGQNIADEARSDLNDGDASNYRWSDTEMLRYINAAQRAIVFILPEANVVEESFTCVVGSRQVLPSGGMKFLKVWNETDARRGKAITQVEEDALNTAFPYWPTIGVDPDDQQGTWFARHFTHDPSDPTVFGLYPPAITGTETVRLKYAKVPTALANLAATFGLRDEFINAAVEYVKFRMLTKDGRYGTEPVARQQLWNNFLQALGIKVSADRRVDPTAMRPPADEHG